MFLVLVSKLEELLHLISVQQFFWFFSYQIVSILVASLIMRWHCLQVANGEYIILNSDK
ncbi:MAG TPA: hypothetical protein VF941_21825 [Clostridia bacterium]